jgi:hypothetical protein
MTKIKPFYDILSLKQLTQRTQNIESCKRKKITDKCKPIKITPDFSTETLKIKRT